MATSYRFYYGTEQYKMETNHILSQDFASSFAHQIGSHETICQGSIPFQVQIQTKQSQIQTCKYIAIK